MSEILSESYTLEELRDHIRVNLGERAWRLEGMGKDQNETINQAIAAATMMMSKRLPRWQFKTFPPLSAGNAFYQLTAAEAGFGVFNVDFVEANSAFGIAGTRYGLIKNLTGVAPAVHGDGIGGDVMEFLMWRKSFHRITSQSPQWRWDEEALKLWVYNQPQYHACAFLFLPRNFEQVRMLHKDLLRRMSIAQAKMILGRMRSKFKDSIQGPGGTTINLDGDGLLGEGEKEWEKLEAELYSVQPRAVPQWD
jgi:hypothetical protein